MALDSDESSGETFKTSTKIVKVLKGETDLQIDIARFFLEVRTLGYIYRHEISNECNTKGVVDQYI